MFSSGVSQLLVGALWRKQGIHQSSALLFVEMNAFVFLNNLFGGNFDVSHHKVGDRPAAICRRAFD